MAFTNVEITLRLYDPHSLKEKRSIVKSILHRMTNRFGVSIAEVGDQDLHNQTVLAIAIASSSTTVAEKMLQAIYREIEEGYPVEILEIWSE